MQPREQLEKFFKELDLLLDSRCELTVIGGTAMVIGYNSSRMTYDCDPLRQIQREIQSKWKVAVKKSGVHLILDTQAVMAQLPEDFESRLEKSDFTLKKLGRVLI